MVFFRIFMLMKTRFLFLFLLLLTSVLQGQIPVTSFHLHQWDLDRLEDSRLGQLSIVQAPTGARLNVQALYPNGYFSRERMLETRGGCLEVADFSHAFVNALGGSYAVFQSAPSAASLSHVVLPYSLPAARLEFVKQEGFCGMWMHLFNSQAPRTERTYFDATRFASLQITLRGTSGSERLLLKIADAAWNEKEDALPVAELSSFLPQGRIDTAWQTAIVPLAAFPQRLDASRLASIALEVTSEGRRSVEISTVFFCTSLNAHEKDTRESQSAPQSEKAIWVWNTDELPDSQNALGDLLQFLQAESIDHVFLALPYDPDHPDARRGVPLDASRLRLVVRALAKAGHRVHALVGDKDFIRPDKRSFVRTTMENILRYQSSVPPSDRFFGVHLDIEPYLLPGFNSLRQPWFLRNLLEVLDLCASAVRPSGLVVGADIPPWLDAPNELTHLPMEVTWNGRTKRMDEHVIDIMDFVVLMDYRTLAEGEDGMVFQAMNELRYAAQTGKKVFVGLETVPLPDETLLVFQGEPHRGMPAPSVEQAVVFLQGTDTLAMLIQHQARSALAGLLRKRQVGEEHILWWPVQRSSRVSASRITFALGGGLPALRQTMQSGQKYLRGFSSFAGFAIHDYLGYRTLVEGHLRQ